MHDGNASAIVCYQLYSCDMNLDFGLNKKAGYRAGFMRKSANSPAPHVQEIHGCVFAPFIPFRL